MLIQNYDTYLITDPIKPKSLILAYTGNVVYNVGRTTIHSALLMPFNKSSIIPLSNEILDALRKIYQELSVVLIDEASLIGICFLYCIYDQLKNIKHVPTKYFRNTDMIFCGDFYQTQPIQDSLIFEQPMINKQQIAYDFWEQNTKCYVLHTTMRQTNEQLISSLNRICTNNQTKEYLQYLNRNCIRPTPNDPTFPYLFYRNKNVVIHNKKMLFIVLGDEFVINAIDNLEENHGNVHFHLHTSTLPLQIVLKLNMLIEIYVGNYDSQDGLVNGVDGIMKAYTNTK